MATGPNPSLEALVYGLLALGAIWPSLGHPDNVPGDGVDLYGTLWFYWWIADSLGAGRDPGFTDLFFHPYGKDIFGHTGNNFVDAYVAAPLLWLLGTPGYYKVWVFVLMVGNALSFRVLARAVFQNRWAVFVSSALFMVNPFLMFELTTGRPTQAFVWFLPLAFWALLRADQLLRCHVCRRAGNHAGLGLPSLGHEALRNAEINDHRALESQPPTIDGDHQVGWLDVAMQHTELVCVLQDLGDPLTEHSNLCGVEGTPPFEYGRQGLALHELTGDPAVSALENAPVENADGRPFHSPLDGEALLPRSDVRGELTRHHACCTPADLQRARLSGLGVLGAPGLSLPSYAKALNQDPRPDSVPAVEEHPISPVGAYFMLAWRGPSPTTAGQGAGGSATRKVVPTPGSLTTSMTPPLWRTMP